VLTRWLILIQKAWIYVRKKRRHNCANALLVNHLQHFSVLPAIVSVIKLQQRTGHSDEQQNSTKIVRFTQQQLHPKPNCVPVRTFPFLNTQRNDSMEQSPSWEVPTASMAKNALAFYGNRKFIIMFKRVQHLPLAQVESSPILTS
jgi:hypothetical protein